MPKFLISIKGVVMYFRSIKYVKNREIHGEDIRRIWTFFSSMTQELIGKKTSGVAGLSFKSDAYGEISGDSDDAIDEAMSRRKPIKEVVFRYESKDSRLSMTLCLQDEFSGFLEGHGGVFEIEGSDKRWFDATIRRFEEMVDTLPQIPLYARLLCRWRWFISALLSLGLSFFFIRVLCNSLTHWAFGGEYPEWANRVLVLISGVLIALFFSIITTFISRNYPVLDLALFKNRINTRQRCLKFFWWVLGALGAVAISMVLSPSEKKENKDIGLPSTTTPNDIQVLRQPLPSESSGELLRSY